MRGGSYRRQTRPPQRVPISAVANPITILAQMIASCHDENNHITIPGFTMMWWWRVPKKGPSSTKPRLMKKEYKDELGVQELWGEKDIPRTNVPASVLPSK